MKDGLLKSYSEILREELIVAAGCTEPIAIALAAAKCVETLGCEPENIEVYASGNIIKNVQGVIIPGTKLLRGVEYAAILGMLAGDSSKQLEILNGLSKDKIDRAKQLYERCICVTKHKKDTAKLYIEMTMRNGDDYAQVEVMHVHTNVTKLIKNDERIFCNPCEENNFNSSLTNRELLNIKDILEYTKTVDIDIIEPTLKRQFEYNLDIIKEGQNYEYGLNVGQTLLKYAHGSVKEKMKAYAASGSDARMSGCDMPVVINSGSGNQGLTIAGPLYIYAKEYNISDNRLYRAAALANLIAIHIKTKIGRLSAFCGAVTAAIGVGCAVTYLNNGTLKNIEDTIKNGLSDLSGMICDGAKPSCAIKIASSIDAAMMSCQLAMENRVVEKGTGIIYSTAEDTINNVSDIVSKAMTETDELILQIMTNQSCKKQA